jgi:hypothetical protein
MTGSGSRRDWVELPLWVVMPAAIAAFVLPSIPRFSSPDYHVERHLPSASSGATPVGRDESGGQPCLRMRSIAPTATP